MQTQDFDVNSFEEEVLSHLTALLKPRTHIGLGAPPAPLPAVASRTRKLKMVDSFVPSKPRRGVHPTVLKSKESIRPAANGVLYHRSESAHIDDSTHQIKSGDMLIEKSAELVPKAQRIVKRKSVRKYLCPALKSVSNDAFEIAKVIIPILAPLSQSVKIPLDPLLFATIAIVIAKVSIAGLCADHNDQ
jgi:hypothetical protein